jgi:ribose/xylose/arabinose/galactoside ABC-type transport system permease subunit
MSLKAGARPDKLAKPPASAHGWVRAAARFAKGREGVLLITLCLLVIVISIGSHGAFWAPVNLNNLMVSAAVTAIPAIGMTLVILTGGIDVSIGSMLGLVAAIGGKFFEAGWSIPAVAPLFCLIGAAFGLVNAAIIIGGRVPPVVATLGTLSIFRMCVFLVLGASWITMIPPELTVIFISDRLWFLPVASVMALVLMAVFAFFLRSFRLGRHIYAIGNNEEAARLAGVPVARIKLYAYTLLGMFTGIAALLTLGQSPLVQTSTGTGFELAVIAAVVLGGTELSGGRGTILGTLLGTLIVGLVNDGVVLMHIQPFWGGVLLGGIILLSIGVNQRWPGRGGEATE